MIRADEDALICDFAETYHIYNYKSLPVRMAATLAAGLRDDSRIKLKLNQQRVSNTDLLLSVIADRLGLLLSMFTAEPPEAFFVDSVFEDIHVPKKQSEVKKYMTPEDFEAARAQFFTKGD